MSNQKEWLCVDALLESPTKGYDTEMGRLTVKTCIRVDDIDTVGGYSHDITSIEMQDDSIIYVQGSIADVFGDYCTVLRGE